MKNLCSLTYKLHVDVDDSSESLKRRIDQLDEVTERWQSSASVESGRARGGNIMAQKLQEVEINKHTCLG